MPRTVVTKPNFLGGELGPLSEGRSDLAQFQLGARRAQNFITLKSGAQTRRPGTRYVKGTVSNNPARLIPFIISFDNATNAYVVEISFDGVDDLEFRVIRVSDNSVSTPTGHALVLDPNNINNVNLFSLDQIQFTQSAGMLFLVSPAFPPQILIRTAIGSPDSFTLTPYVGYSDPSRPMAASLPYLDENISATTLTVSATTGTGVTLTSSTNLFSGTSADIGKYFAILNATLGSCVVTGNSGNSKTVCQVTVLDTFPDTSAHTAWWEGSWSPDRGWPRSICFYAQRLVFGGCTANPDTFWMSKVGNYLKMSNVNAAFAINDPLKFSLASQKLNQIQWMIGGKNHTIGTSSSEWVGQVTNDGTNLFVQYDEETTHGSAPIQPFRSAYTIPFVQRSGQTIREMAYEFYSATYPSTDLTMISSHIGTRFGSFESDNVASVSPTSYLTQCTQQESPLTLMWVIDNNGRLFGLTRDKQQQIASWHSHVIGGRVTSQDWLSLAGADFPAMVKSICVMMDPTTRLDRLWMVVRRTINGASTYTVEFMDDVKPNIELTGGYTATNIMAFLDCATWQTGGANTAWAGYTRFASDSAYVIAQGTYGQIVFNGILPVDSGGNITLPVAATAVTVGLNVNAELRLLPIEGGENPKVNLRSISRIDLCTVKLFETFGLRIGKDRLMTKTGYVDNTSFEAISFDNSKLPVLPTFTGYKEAQVPHSAENDAAYALVMQEPWPCTILSVSSRVVTNEI